MKYRVILIAAAILTLSSCQLRVAGIQLLPQEDEGTVIMRTECGGPPLSECPPPPCCLIPPQMPDERTKPAGPQAPETTYTRRDEPTGPPSDDPGYYRPGEGPAPCDPCSVDPPVPPTGVPGTPP